MLSGYFSYLRISCFMVSFKNLCIFGLVTSLSGCVSFPNNFPPQDSKEKLHIAQNLTVNNPFNTHYAGKGHYKLVGTIDNDRFYRPQDPTLFSHAPMRYLRVDLNKPDEVCVIYVDLVNCIETSFEVIDYDPSI